MLLSSLYGLRVCQLAIASSVSSYRRLNPLRSHEPDCFPFRLGEQDAKRRQHPPRLFPVHRHPEPVGRLLSFHRFDAFRHRPHVVPAPHRRQGPEEQPQGKRQVLRDRVARPLRLDDPPELDSRLRESPQHPVLDELEVPSPEPRRRARPTSPAVFPVRAPARSGTPRPSDRAAAPEARTGGADAGVSICTTLFIPLISPSPPPLLIRMLPRPRTSLVVLSASQVRLLRAAIRSRTRA